MTSIRITSGDVSLRYGELDTPVPESRVPTGLPPRVVVAVAPADPRTRAQLVYRVDDGPEQAVPLRLGQRTREEQFFEGSIPNLRDGSIVEYWIRVELRSTQDVSRLDSSQTDGGIGRFQVEDTRFARAGQPAATVDRLAGNATGSPREVTERAAEREPTRLESRREITAAGVGTGRPAGDIRRRIPEIGKANDPQSASDRRDTTSYSVQGHVADRDLRGLSAVQVVAVDKNVGDEVPLAEAITGERGTYEIRFDTGKLREGKEKPDIQVLAVGDGRQVLATSEVRYNAGVRETGLNIMIPKEQLPRPAEYRRLVADLGIHLGPQAEPERRKQLASLREDDEQQDISYLANKAGWDARMVAMTALANQFSSRSGIEPEFYYALFRGGLPANDAVLSRLPPEAVQSAWERAVEQHILPEELRDKIPENLERFRNQSARQLLEGPAQIGVSGLSAMLGQTLPDAASQQRFASLYYEHQDDSELFWESVQSAFPREADRLQKDGKLAFLTINNAPLVQRLRARNGEQDTPIDLVRSGFYKSEEWERLLDDSISIPPEIPGDKPQEQRANYAAVMANQLRLSYPTAVVSAMVKADAIPLHAEQPVKDAVTQFLDTHQDRFELGLHPVERYLRQNDLNLDDTSLAQVKRLQRVYQISPSDEAMGSLLEHNLDSAYAVVRYDERTFVDTFKDELGGESSARLMYAKAHQVHHAVVNIVTEYMLEKTATPVFAIQNLTEQNGAAPLDAEETDVLAYPTLEGIFGEMDYCACEHCRSWLSPAAYLVDLLQFLDPPVHEKENPLEVLLSRRPDIQHLQLTCENTNTALPYIDLVNEVLEHYVVNGSLETFAGHNVEEGMTTEELLANPQFVKPTAYTSLRTEQFPPPLPFHQPLEALRRYFEHFDILLADAMTRLRRNDNMNRPSGPDMPGYGWLDILIERLRLSRPEYKILTDSSIALQTLYGEDSAAVSEGALIDQLSNAKAFARRLDLTYDELITITRTRFVNPYSRLIPRLEKLGINFATIHDLTNGILDDAALEALLPDDLDQAPYGGDVKQWLRDNEAQIMQLILLSDPEGGEDVCSFDAVELRYALPDTASNKLKSIEFLKLLRFIRLWRKLGWSIEQTDRTIAALYPADEYPQPGDSASNARTKLDAGFQTLIPRVAHLLTVMEQLNATPGRVLPGLLAFWSPIDTHGIGSLYRQMFLNPGILALDTVFVEDGYGGYLAEKKEFLNGAPKPKMSAHVEALRAAFSLTQEEFDLLRQALEFNDDTELNLANISDMFRHGNLARLLRLRVRELLALKTLSGIDPFMPLDLTNPPDPAEPFGSVRPAAIRFIEMAQRIKESPLKVSQLLYFLRHEDLSGKASPPSADVLAFARTIRKDLLRIEGEHVVEADPTGEIARNKMALVYGGEATDIFFGLLAGTSQFSTAYDHGQAELEDSLQAVTDRISYDDFQKQLSFRGLMTTTEKAALDAAPGSTAAFRTAVQALVDDSHQAFSDYFDRYPDLRPLYENYIDSTAPDEERTSALLADFLPDLRARLKRQHIHQTMSSQLGVDLSMVTPLLENEGLLHAIGQPDHAAMTDILRLETQGVSADVFFANDVTGVPDQPNLTSGTIDYRAGGDELPANPAGGAATVSGVWRGFLEAPDNGHYNISVEADSGAEIEITLDNEPVPLKQSNGTWTNQDAIELVAGSLYPVQLTARKVKNRLALKWWRKGLGREPVPAGQLYPAIEIARFQATYLRLLKAVAIADALELSARELKHFAAHDDYFIDGKGWLNALPTAPSPESVAGPALIRNILSLLEYLGLKESLKIRDERLLEVLQAPETTDDNGVLLLERVTGWSEADRSDLLDHIGLNTAGLAHLQHVVRLHGAFTVVKALGVGGASLVSITTNEPTASTVNALQTALRARYDRRSWLQVIQPINDELRDVQRDALVTYVLQQLRQDSSTEHIDTPDKLFEYFLVDVEMDPCMATSRIRQALSSVQLFIQRCLLNLEPQVASSAINATQWEWMKRYRVWEANRKVFLFPENWLEPELRDNKSPAFKDLESELLQGDITDDAAATALVHYLEKLDEVAKLEICGMYYVENELNNTADDVIHVIGRTAGARRTYYYRRQVGGIAWTPWEKIDLNIEDTPVLPVVWKGRLFLFWVSVLQEGPTESGASDTNDAELNLTSVKPSQLRGVASEPKSRVTLTLYWSEHYHGKWQPARTSDVNQPLPLGSFEATGNQAFNRALLFLSSSISSSGPLTIYVDYEDRGRTSFKLYNTHSLPVRSGDETIQMNGYEPFTGVRKHRALGSAPGVFAISYGTGFYMNDYLIEGDWASDSELLGRADLYAAVAPRHDVGAVYLAPFFFQDRQHVFFVTTDESLVLVGTLSDFGVRARPNRVFEEHVLLVKADGTWPPDDDILRPGFIDPGVIDPSPMQAFLARDHNIHRVIGTAGTITFGDRNVGPSGSVPANNIIR